MRRFQMSGSTDHRTEQGADLGRLVRKRRTDGTAGDGVDEVPPGAGDDEFLDGRENRGSHPALVAGMVQDFNRRVALFTLGGAAPDVEQCVLPGIGIREWAFADERRDDLPHPGHCDAKERHRRLHVGLLALGPFRIGGGA